MRDRFYGPILAAVLVGAFVLASCSTTPPPAPSETSTTATKPYGSLTIQATFEERGAPTDPHMAGSGATFQALGAAFFDSLVELAPDGQPRPGIAERWEISPDGKTHTFYIRKGVKFHDGSDLTGVDVKFSLERMLAPESMHSDALTWRAAMARVDLIDSYTVAVQMKSPQFDLLRGFPDMSGSQAVVSKKYIEEKGVAYFTEHPAGSGPWKVLSYKVGARIELEAVESHWRAVPKFKNVTLLSVREEASKVAMLKTGELDIAEVTHDSVPALKSAGLRTISYKAGGQLLQYLFYDLENPARYPLGDIRVRKALSLALNRREMADQLMGGYAEPHTLFQVMTTAYFFDPNVLKPDPFDPEQAKKLLVEAGYPNGFNMKLWNSGVGNETVLNLAVAGYWRKIGVNAEVVAKDAASIVSMWTPKLTPEIYNTAVGKEAVSAHFGFDKMPVYHSKKSSLHNIKNLRLDELIDKVPTLPMSDEKKRLALEAAVLARNEYANLSVLETHTILALGSKVGGLTPVDGVAGNAYNLATITHGK